MVIATAAPTVAGVVLMYRNKSNAVQISVVAALLVSPLSWPTYSLVALPVVAQWWRRRGTLWLATLSSPVVLSMFTPSRWRGHFIFAALVLPLVHASKYRGIPSPTSAQIVSESGRRA